ncbi:hypothetical protein B0H11DRAFT_2206308 [Mycena galericulata]|nr:hypothetical protein B0H11DRAFT_2206308 [Mycena galericulata]
MVNTTGANGTDNGVFPSDEELREILFDFERKSLSRELRLRYLEEKHHITIGSLFRWLWSKIVQTGLDEFVDYFNNKKTRKQRNRILPSGVAPNVVFDMPANYGLENLAIPVTQAALDELRGLIDTPREDAFRWVSDGFDEVATAVYIRIGSPKLEALSGWAIFNGMAPLLRGVVDPSHL